MVYDKPMFFIPWIDNPNNIWLRVYIVKLQMYHGMLYIRGIYKQVFGLKRQRWEDYRMYKRITKPRRCRSFEAFTSVIFQVVVFWVVMPCSVVVEYHHFRVPCCLHLHCVVTPCSVVVGYQRFRSPCCPHLQSEITQSKGQGSLSPVNRRQTHKVLDECWLLFWNFLLLFIVITCG
jgi:hypothetical protein